MLAEAGLPVAIVNPRQVRKFAGAIGRLAETEAIDAAAKYMLTKMRSFASCAGVLSDGQNARRRRSTHPGSDNHDLKIA